MTAESLETRIQRLEDESAIKKLINTYLHRVDTFDWDRWSETFIEDAEFEAVGAFGVLKGRQAIYDTLKGQMGSLYEYMQHVIVNVDVELQGDRATGVANLVFAGTADKEDLTRCQLSGGRYSWQFVRTSEGWRFARTRIQVLWIGPDGINAAAIRASEGALT